MEVAVGITLVIGLAVAVRVAAGALDGGRIRDYFTARGCRLLWHRWTPFGPGWFGAHSSRLYAIEYLDRSGHRWAAACKTNMLAGVYISNERLVEMADPARVSPIANTPTAVTQAAGPANPNATELERLRAENAALRAQLQRPNP